MPHTNLVTSPQSIPLVVFRMTLLLLPGMLSIVILNLTDTYFVARLGTDPLAGISFTFPIVFLFGQLALGLGIGLTTSAATALGRSRHDLATSQSSLFITLICIISLLLVPILLALDRPILALLGARSLPQTLASQYMFIWYLGLPFFAGSIIANAAIRATGDTWSASLPMVVAAIVNIILDPVLIFGFTFIPPLGIRGAAIATITARLAAFLLSLHILYHKEKLLSLPPTSPRHIIFHLRHILHAGIPTAIMKSFLALSIAIVTAIIASFSTSAVAAYGVGSRLQAFAAMPTFALATAILTFAAQNHAAHRHDRIQSAFKFTHTLAISWGLFCLALLASSSSLLADLFTSDPSVYRALRDFLRIAPLGYAPLALTIVISSEFIAINHPYRGAIVGILKHIFVYAPFIYIGGRFFGIPGLFWGMVVANTTVCILGYTWLKLTFQPPPLPNPNTLQ